MMPLPEKAGAQYSQSPVEAEDARGDDATYVLSRRAAAQICSIPQVFFKKHAWGAPLKSDHIQKLIIGMDRPCLFGVKSDVLTVSR
jgi:hypothetical protein